MDKNLLKKIIQQEIARVREDALLKPPSPGEEGYYPFTFRSSDTCPECGEDPCVCDDYNEACPACGMNPCRCIVGNKMKSHSLTCPTCGGVTVMSEGCGCGGTGVSMPDSQVVYADILNHLNREFDGHHHEEEEVEVHHGGAYMAKSQLHKIEEYARKLQEMIPDGYDLDDWMRSHISQAADDIGEVYHKLEYDYHSGH